MSKPDGGPAFPGSKIVWAANGTEIDRVPILGMSLRDYFAAAALIADVDEQGEWPNDEKRAQWCYRMADAMLKAREQ